MDDPVKSNDHRVAALLQVRDQLSAALGLSDTFEEFMLSAHIALALDTTDALMRDVRADLHESLGLDPLAG